jgi:type IV secretion system protein TrbI
MTIKDPLATVQAPSSESVSSNGKASRNYKNFVFVLLGIGIVVGLLFTSLFPKTEKKAVVQEVGKTTVNMAEELAERERRNAKPKDVVLPVPLEELKSPESNGVAEKEEKERLRLQSIIGSAMDSNVEFSMRSNSSSSQTKNLSASVERLEALKEQKDLQNRLLANSDKITNAGLANSAANANNLASANLSSDSAFLANRARDSFESPVQLHEKHRGHALYQGHLIRTVLLKGINSDMPGDILAKVVSDVFDSVDGRILLIPKGTVIYGAYSSGVSVGQSRLLVATDRMIFPNGTSASLQKSSVSSMTGFAGLDSKVDNHFFQMFGTSLLVGAASWLMPAADQATTSTTGAAGVTTGGSLMAQAVGGAMKDIGSRNKNIKPTLTVGQGEMFLIEIGRDVVLPEYVN